MVYSLVFHTRNLSRVDVVFVVIPLEAVRAPEKVPVVALTVPPSNVPVAPVGPCGPCGPVAPVGPVLPVLPLAPVAPVGPCIPCGP